MTEFCSICGRVKWGRWQVLPFNRWRHDECALGTELWKEYYECLSYSNQKPLREFYNLTYNDSPEQ